MLFARGERKEVKVTFLDNWKCNSAKVITGWYIYSSEISMF